MANITLRSLTGLIDNNNTALSDTNIPVLNTGILINTDPTNGVPMTCGSIVDTAKGDGTVNSFLQRYKLFSTNTNGTLTSNIQNFRDKLIGNNIKQTQTIPTSDSNKAIQTYLNTIQTSQLPVLRQVSNCLSEASNPDYNKIEETKKQVDTSKTRLESILDSDSKVSYYEGWFPLFRPMSEVSLFSLFAVSIFSLLFSIAVFLRLNGVELELIIPGGSEFSTESFVSYVKIGSILAVVISLFVIFIKK